MNKIKIELPCNCVKSTPDLQHKYLPYYRRVDTFLIMKRSFVGGRI